MTDQQINNARTATMMYVHYDERINDPSTSKEIKPILQQEQRYWENEYHKAMPLDVLWQTPFS